MKARAPYRRFAIGGAAAMLALAALSIHVVAESRGRARALAEVLFHEDARTALWQMETRVTALLGAITYEERDSVLGSFEAVDPGVMMCSIDPQTFEVEPVAAPTNEVAMAACGAADDAFQTAAPLVAAGLAETQTLQPAWTDDIKDRGAPRTNVAYQQRIDSIYSNSLGNRMQQVGPSSHPVTVGPLGALWSGRGGDLALLLSRRIDRGDASEYESFVVDWGDLADVLLASIDGLLPGAEVVPILEGEPDPADGMRLAAVPVRLDAEAPHYAASLDRTFLVPLLGAWFGLVVALVASWTSVRASIAYGEKHRRFTQAVTHELRTPLTTFRMYSEMLRVGMVPEGARDEYLEALESESQRLVALVDNVLRYARLEEGSALPARRPVAVGEVVESVMRSVGAAAERAGARLDARMDGPVSERVVVTDPEAVEQILGNLVDNALKYGLPDAERGDAPRVELAVTEGPGGVVRFDVRDEGPGVPPEARSAVFDPFERAGRDSADPAPGVGLGLSLSRQLARQLDGRLELLDSVRGSCFRLTLGEGQPQA